MNIASERRKPKENRIPFDGYVEVGGLTGSTFKARAVDLSAGGMHLRASELPEIGTPLSCRFDSAADTVVCEGEVVWRRESAKGGDFGLRFRQLDTESERVLRELCTIDHELGPGARVRLHLKGLAQPLHARVVESNDNNLVTASELGFLKAGTDCVVEERDTDTRKGATLEDVRVRVHPESGAPELTVRMGWTDKRASTPALDISAPRFQKTEAAMQVQAEAVVQTTSDAPTMPTNDDKTPLDSVPPVAFEQPSVAPVALSASPDEEDDLAWKEQIETVMAGVRKVREVFTRKSSPAPRQSDERPRRVTAAPPRGALHADGKHVVRRQGTPKVETPETSTPAEWVARNKRTLALGSAVGLSALLGVFALTRGDNTKENAAAAIAAAESGSNAAAVVQGSEVAQLPPAAPLAVAPYDPATAAGFPAAGGAPGTPSTATPWAQAVPAQGAYPTPAAPAAPSAWPAPVETAPSRTVTSAADFQGDRLPVAAAAPRVEERSSEEPRAHKKSRSVKPFGTVSGVASGKTLRLHMNGPIEQIQGAHTPTGFTVDLPNVRAVEPAAPLAASDPRIESMRVRNSGQRAELVVEFKDGIPEYMVRAKDDVLEIVIANKSDKAPVAAAAAAEKPNKAVKKPAVERVRARRRHR